MTPESGQGRDEHARTRLLQGLDHSIAARGYRATTVADVVAAAAMSKRTFYEHYADKDACLLDHFARRSDEIIAELGRAAAAAAGPVSATRAGIEAYFACLAGEPAVTRAHLMEILALGDEGIVARRRVTSRYAAALRTIVQTPDPHGRRLELGEHRVTALVGGLNELALRAVEEDRLDALHEVVDDADAFFRSVVRGLPEEA